MADDQEVIRQGLAVLLASSEIRLVAEAAKVIMISAHDNPSYVARAVVLGAVNFLLKDAPGEAYVAAIHRAVAGGESAADTLFSQIRALLIVNMGLGGGGI